MRYFHAVEPYFPPDARCSEYWRLPVVLHEPDVMLSRLETEQVETSQICVLYVGCGRLDNHLQLMVHVEAVGVLTVPTICWAS